MSPTLSPGAGRAAAPAVVGLLLVAALLAPATGVAGAAPEPAPAGQTEPVENVTDDAEGTVTGTIDDGGDTVDDTGDTVDDSVEDASAVDTVTGTVDDTTGTLENETSDVTDSLESGVNDTLEASGSLEGTATAGAGGNATGEADGSDAGAGTVQLAGGSGDGTAPTLGGGLPPAAGGVAALGVATAAGATLLQRSRWPPALRTVRVARHRPPAVELPPWLRWLAGLAGYSRYDDSDPLAHDTREALHRRIEGSPGVHLSALADAADVPLSTARHHLRVLEEEGVVDTAVIRGRRCYFPASTEHQALEAAMADETQATVLSTLAEREWATVSEVADAVDVDASTATYQLKRLAAADLVERERDGRAVRNRLAPHVEPFFEGAAAD